MSIPVELQDLRAKTAEYAWAYLLTVRPDGTPHIVSLSTQWAVTGTDALVDDASGRSDGVSGNSAADDGAAGVGAGGDGAAVDSAAGDSAAGVGAAGDGAAGDSAAGDGAVGDGAAGDGAVGDGATVDGVSGDGKAGASLFLLMPVSAGTARNASAGAQVTLCYPPLDQDGYSLIIDGTAGPLEQDDCSLIIDRTVVLLDGQSPAGIDPVPDGKVLLRFEPTGAVLHRSVASGVPSPSATGCANDCLPVEPSTV